MNKLSKNAKEKINNIIKDSYNYETVEITRGVQKLIEESIEEGQTCNRYKICDIMCQKMIEKYGGEEEHSPNLEYQSGRMKVKTTREILQAIDTYFFKYLKPQKLNKRLSK